MIKASVQDAASAFDSDALVYNSTFISYLNLMAFLLAPNHDSARGWVRGLLRETCRQQPAHSEVPMALNIVHQGRHVPRYNDRSPGVGKWFGP